ncbi:Ankyrin repeat domain containing protein [Pandoravirus neocaledonia]|uniref:Ankyrin repeat domain containing protein n=1 Tax=Pandoravirus neocaledonia TaxID=2107708 RepID=A0A2U7UD72_9VIRU|nr:Ankyrin repeat domain containing protein [Pandoravirus neocaledonia]AVK76394.1 Ankyrin repeat domain containing protein [Pandoravirus neocaledonia]
MEPSSVVDLPPEMMTLVLAHLDDRDFCAARAAHRSFRVDTADEIESRATKWRGCRTLADFGGRGNAEAVCLLLALGTLPPRDVRACCGTASFGGHLDVVRVLVRHVAFDAKCASYDAARGGHVHILEYARRDQWLDCQSAVAGAIRGDSVAAFVWACGVGGISPSVNSICAALGDGSDDVLAHCLASGIGGPVFRGQLAVGAAGRFRGIIRPFVKTLTLLLDDSTLSEAQWAQVVDSVCRSSNTDAAEIVYRAWPQLFGSDAMTAAISAGESWMLQWLCNKGVRACSREALADAVSSGHDDTVRLACERDIQTDRTAAICEAARGGNIALLDVLLDGQNESGFYAAYYGATDRATGGPRDFAILEWLHECAPSP